MGIRYWRWNRGWDGSVEAAKRDELPIRLGFLQQKAAPLDDPSPVHSGTAGFRGLSPDLADRLNQLPEVEAASGVRFGFVEVDESTQGIYAIDTATIESLVDVSVVEGCIDEMGPGDIGVFQDWADDRGLGVGSRLNVRFPESGSQLLTISVIFTEDELTENFFISHEAYDANFRDSFDFQVA